MSSLGVTEAVRSRRSVRAFLDKPVPLTLLREALELAARAPSGGNLQPWWIHVVAGARLEELRGVMRERVLTEGPDPAEYEIYPANLWEPYRSRRYDIGELMYAALGIERNDKLKRLERFAQNYQLFGAPVGLFCFIERRMGAPQWSDLGMYLQTLMLLLRERGVDSCAQEAWSAYHRVVGDFVGSPPERMLFCGMAIGYADPDAPVNHLSTPRAALDDFTTFHGF
ncbi:MAG: nitroreductase [Myxococcales bacterium]